jgi:LuxR family transcriptional regulator, maltose regulon positive regulatory protein
MTEGNRVVEALLATKLLPPQLRERRVPRAHLVQRLEEGYRAGRRLTLVCAPAGWGKTALVRE